MASKTDRPKLLDQADAADVATYGEGWVEVPHFDDLEIHFFGLGAGDEVVIEKSNEDGTPSNAVEEVRFTGAGPHYHEISGNPYQVRAGFVTDGGNNSTVTAIAHFRKRN